MLTRMLLFLAILFTRPAGGVATPTVITAANLDHLTPIAQFDPAPELRLGQRLLWTPDGQQVVIITQNQVLVYGADAVPGEPIPVLTGDRQLQRAVFSPDGEFLAIVSGLVDPASPMLTDPVIHLLSFPAGRLIRDIAIDATPDALAFSSDAASLLVVDRQTWNFSRWDVTTGDRLQHYVTNQPGFPWDLSAAFNADASLLALGTGGTANEVSVWSTETGELVASSEAGYADRLTFSPDSTLLAGSSRYGGFGILWQFQQADAGLLLDFPVHQTRAATFSPDGRLYVQLIALVTQSDHYLLQFIDAGTGIELTRLEIPEAPAMESDEMALAFSPDGTRLLVYNAGYGLIVMAIQPE